MFAFLEENHLLAVVRAHEYAESGFMFHFDSEEYKEIDTRDDKSMPPLITVFSAANYCDRHGNLVGIMCVSSYPRRHASKPLAAARYPLGWIFDHPQRTVQVGDEAT